jgi:hypothetical protein
MAFNEVVIAVIDRPNALHNLRRFALLLATGTTLLTLSFAATPVANLWLGRIMALPPNLKFLSRTGLWIGLFIPFFAVLQNWYQGIIVSSHQTRGATEAVIIYIATIGLLLSIGIMIQSINGLFVTIAAYEFAGLTQSIWLWLRSRPAVKTVTERDKILTPGLSTPSEVG